MVTPTSCPLAGSKQGRATPGEPWNYHAHQVPVQTEWRDECQHLPRGWHLRNPERWVAVILLSLGDDRNLSGELHAPLSSIRG